MASKELAAICLECEKLNNCTESMRFETKMMYCSEFEKSHKLNENQIPQIEINKMRIAIDMKEVEDGK